MVAQVEVVVPVHQEKQDAPHITTGVTTQQCQTLPANLQPHQLHIHHQPHVLLQVQVVTTTNWKVIAIPVNLPVLVVLGTITVPGHTPHCQILPHKVPVQLQHPAEV